MIILHQPPGYQVSVSDGRITLVPVAAIIDFDVTPILTTNQLVINQGQVIVLTENNLRATHAEIAEGDLNFIISNVQQGQFAWTANPQLPILQFLQKNITDKQVQFAHDNSSFAPAYKVSVSDGRMTTESASSRH